MKKIFYFILLFLLMTFFSANTAFCQCGEGFTSGAGGVCYPSNTNLPDPSGGVNQILSNFMLWILAIFGFLAVIAFSISGIQYILSAGDERSVDNAKRHMTWSMIGVVVALSGIVILYAVTNLISANPNF